MSLVISKLSKRYDQKWVLRDVSVRVEPGQIVGVFGLTGAGKTTLINAIAGQTSIDGGQIHFDDTDVTKMSCADRKFHLPALTNKSIWKSLFGDGKKSELADGEGQAVALRNLLDHVDGVLLLDNSFCDMDRNMRRANFQKLKAVVKHRAVRTIFATNDYSEVFELCDMVAVLHHGEIAQFGTPKEVYESPVDRSVAAMIDPHNNLFEARRLTSSKAEVPQFRTIAGEHDLFAEKHPVSKLGPLNQNVTLSIRPEHVSISFGASFPEDNLLKAIIKNVTFQGPTTLVDLDCEGLELKALVLRLVGLNPGDECMVGLPPDRIRIYAA